MKETTHSVKRARKEEAPVAGDEEGKVQQQRGQSTAKDDAEAPSDTPLSTSKASLARAPPATDPLFAILPHHVLAIFASDFGPPLAPLAATLASGKESMPTIKVALARSLLTTLSGSQALVAPHEEDEAAASLANALETPIIPCSTSDGTGASLDETALAQRLVCGRSILEDGVIAGALCDAKSASGAGMMLSWFQVLYAALTALVWLPALP